MRKEEEMTRQRSSRALLVLGAAGLMALVLAGTAQAKLTGAYTVFQQCPYENAETNRCLYSLTEGGVFIMGSKEVPIEEPVTLQAGYTKVSAGFSKLVAAKNGKTLSESPQNVPGGLAGLVNCKEISNKLLRIICETALEKGPTAVHATVELAKPPSEVLFSETHFAEEEGVTFKLPVKVHLENPFLGGSCYVGSSSNPIMLELTTGFTNPPEPNKPIRGSAGNFEVLENAQVLRTTEDSVVDNAWEAPGASGCGEALSLILDPIVNVSAGLPAKAGTNTAILNGTSSIAIAAEVKKNDEEHP
jgi:hypothetical protein